MRRLPRKLAGAERVENHRAVPPRPRLTHRLARPFVAPRSLSWALRACALATLAVAACANNPERLPELDRRFYYNLESKNDQEAFLDLRDEERQDFLEREGLWQKWAALPEAQRNAAADGEIEIGFFEFATFMAWGPPADTQTRDPDGRAVRQHTFIRCTSGPKVGRYVREVLECDGTSSEIVVTIRDGKVSEIAYPH